MNCVTKEDFGLNPVYVTAHRQQIITALENWSEKYAVPLHQIEAERDAAATKLADFLKELGYAE